MNQTDEGILEMLYSSGLILTPTVLSENLEYEWSGISERLGKLREIELVERVGRGKYRISEKGERFLTGQFDANDLELEEGDDE